MVFSERGFYCSFDGKIYFTIRSFTFFKGVKCYNLSILYVKYAFLKYVFLWIWGHEQALCPYKEVTSSSYNHEDHQVQQRLMGIITNNNYIITRGSHERLLYVMCLLTLQPFSDLLSTLFPNLSCPIPTQPFLHMVQHVADWVVPLLLPSNSSIQPLHLPLIIIEYLVQRVYIYDL